jgi:hypothetical protein
MQRREFITLPRGSAAWVFAARAQNREKRADWLPHWPAGDDLNE